MSKTITLFLFLVLLVPTATFSQAALEPFTPKECRSQAVVSAIQASAGSRLIAIVNGAYEFDFFASTYKTGMSLDDGKAIAWIYAFYQPNGDSVFFKPYAKLPFVGCVDASQYLPNISVPATQLGRDRVPDDYAEGTALIAALNTNVEYVAFHTANPDSLPSATVLTVSQTEVPSFPVGTPFWFLTWTPTQSGSALTCFVHALSSETICVGNIASVADDATAAGFNLAPNPAFDNATLTLPLSWMGTTATIEAVDATGSITELSSAQRLLSPALNISLSSLQSGMYTMRIRNQRQATVIPMSVLR